MYVILIILHIIHDKIYYKIVYNHKIQRSMEGRSEEVIVDKVLQTEADT